MRYTIVGVPTFLGTLNVFVINDKMGRLFARSKFSIVSVTDLFHVQFARILLISSWFRLWKF